MIATAIELGVMAGFMVGAIVGEMGDQRADEREVRDMAEAEEWLSDLRVAFTDAPAEVAA